MMDFFLRNSPIFYFTQSVWRDEAFSILLASRPIVSFLKISFEPPFYYILLHYWMKLFGENELMARGLSLLGFSLATIVVIVWAEKLFKKHWLSWYLPVFFFFNPMLLYYAFEIRAYGWYMFFAVLSMYAYMEQKWKLYVISTILGLYTHTYMVIVPAMQVLHYIVIRKKINILKRFSTFIHDPMVRSVLVVGVLFAPWLAHVLVDLPRLKSSWYFPVDMNLVRSVVGNVFLGYEGTPGNLWNFTAFLSLVLVFTIFVALKNKRTRSRNAFFAIMTIIPLIIVIGISFIKPLYVNRYVIPVTITEVFIVIFAIENIQNHLTQKLVALFSLLFILGFNMWYPTRHAKLDIRSTIYQINHLMGPHDVLLADSPLIFFESVYYSQDRSKVYFYDPYKNPFPWYVGDAIVAKSKIVSELPPYPIRAFIVHANGTYEMSYNMNK